MDPKKAEPGSVSSATMRPEDLIPAFLDELEELDKDKHDRIVAEYVGMGWPGSHDRQMVDLVVLDPLPDGLREMSGYLLEELFDALGEVAPDGHYFGASEGDGSDFGYWPYYSEHSLEMMEKTSDEELAARKAKYPTLYGWVNEPEAVEGDGGGFCQ